MKLDEASILITGGTGSSDNAFLQQLLAGSSFNVRVLSGDEKKQEYLQHSCSNERLKFYIGDVRDTRSVLAEMLARESFSWDSVARRMLDVCRSVTISTH